MLDAHLDLVAVAAGVGPRRASRRRRADRAHAQVVDAEQRPSPRGRPARPPARRTSSTSGRGSASRWMRPARCSSSDGPGLRRLDAAVVDALGEDDEVAGEAVAADVRATARPSPSSTCSRERLVERPAVAGAAAVVLAVRADEEERMVDRLARRRRGRARAGRRAARARAARSSPPRSAVELPDVDARARRRPRRSARRTKRSARAAAGARSAREVRLHARSESVDAVDRVVRPERRGTRSGSSGRRGSRSPRAAPRASRDVSAQNGFARHPPRRPRHADHLAGRDRRRPARRRAPATMPGRCAAISFSIFIASTTQITCPALDRVALGDLDRRARCPASG